jgi:hypothetical protein
MASAVTGGFQNASFGNEEELDSLVEEVYIWMIGKSPSDGQTNGKRIAGTIDAEIDD